ncbi:TPA: hypothetical protein NES72_002585 [Klebsiella pneumoniae]|nr:hypothetical protein [Klebsiella pneumoniae]HCE0845891.1 hypothetical protein [Klebsiella pneumoniae]
MLLADLAKTAYGPFCFAWKMRKVSAFAGKFEREMCKMPQHQATTVLDSQK